MACAVRLAVAVVVLGGCGAGATPIEPEVVIEDASLGGAMPQVLGATATTVFWTASTGSTTIVGGASLASLPAAATELATATGRVADAGDYVVFGTTRSIISRVDGAGTIERITSGAPDALAGNSATPPVVAWTVGPMVSWGFDDVQKTATLNRITKCDHALVTAAQIYVAADDGNGRRLFRIDQTSGDITPITSSVAWAPMFPGGAMAGATYKGRIVGGDDDAVLWLVEEMPSRRGILVRAPGVGEPSVLLEHIAGASGFWTSEDALYWQEGDALLTAAREGGQADLVATKIGTAGAYADGYIYFTSGVAIERVRVE